MRTRLGGWLLCAGLQLAGCGDGQVTPFDDFFGGGTVPGSSFDDEQPGRVIGRVQVNRAGVVSVVNPANALPAETVPVPGAVVTLVELRREAVTGADGGYAFADVPAAIYTLRISLPEPFGESSDFRIRLEPGGTVAGLPTGD